MKTHLIAATLLTSISIVAPTQAENLSHTSQLLSSKQCPLCDLSGAGLMMADLSGANLAGANLSRANLSRADLSNADLRGADLSGTSLHGANLMGANLTGANLNGTDLREAYLNEATLTDANINTNYTQGTVGVPNHAATPEQFYHWATLEGKKSNYRAAIGYYNQALSVDPEFANAYLGRGLARYRLGDLLGAQQDAKHASQLFETQENETGYQASQQLVEGLEIAINPPERRGSGSSFKNILMSVGSLAVQFLFGGGI